MAERIVNGVLLRVGRLARVGWLARRVRGTLVECGVENGHSATILALNSLWDRHRDVWLFDSFEGLPEPTGLDGSRAISSYQARQGRWCVGSEALVREAFGHIGWPNDRLHIVRGWFADTLPGADVGPIAVLHVDADWYESVRLCLARFWPDVVCGGVLVVDDYYHWPGTRQAVDEFLGFHAPEMVPGEDPGYWYAVKR